MTGNSDVIVKALPDRAWLPISLRSENFLVSVRWCPFVTLPAESVNLGLCENGEWSWSQKSEGVTIAHPLSGRSIVGALPLLEVSYAEVRQQVEGTAARYGPSTAAILEVLPLKAILLTALGTRSDYWVALALAWLEDGAAQGLEQDVRAIVADKQLSQSVRHRARRFIKLKEA